MFGSYIFLIFSASLLIAVTFGVAGVLPLAISGMETDLEINYLSISLAFAVGQAVTGIANPLGGAMADKFGYHRAMLIGIILSTPIPPETFRIVNVAETSLPFFEITKPSNFCNLSLPPSTTLTSTARVSPDENLGKSFFNW